MILETAETTLLAPFDLEAQKLERVFGTLAARKVDYADLYFQYSRYEGWSLEEGIVKSGSFNIEQGVGVRAISGEKTAFAYSDEISFNGCRTRPRRRAPSPPRDRREERRRRSGAPGAAARRRSHRLCRFSPKWLCSRSWSANAARSTRASPR